MTEEASDETWEACIEAAVAGLAASRLAEENMTSVCSRALSNDAALAECVHSEGQVNRIDQTRSRKRVSCTTQRIQTHGQGSTQQQRTVDRWTVGTVGQYTMGGDGQRSSRV